MFPQPVIESVESFLSRMTGKMTRIVSSMVVSGGCINKTIKIRTEDDTYFVKYNLADEFPDMFGKEAAGLTLLREKGKLRLPEPLHVDTIEKYSYILLEFISTKNRVPSFWQMLGEGLAGLHKQSHTTFGLDYDNYIGSLLQKNTAHSDWNEFFVVERLEPMIKLAYDKNKITGDLVNLFDPLFSRLSRLIPAEKPALLHGDLWSGNYMVDDKGNPCLVDPSVYYGHREVDLAMTRLFGGFAPPFYDHYQKSYPLEKGWEERTDIFNLYPLLVHINLFGGGYETQVRIILKRFR